MAASISVNFSENNGNQSWLTPATDIGPISVTTANFNNTNNPTGGPANVHTGTLAAGTLGGIVDDSGASVAGAVVTWESSNVWFSGAGTVDNNARLNVGYLDDGAIGDGGGIEISMTNVPYALYDVYVLLASDQSNLYSARDVSVNGDGFGSDVLGYAYLGADPANTAWTEATDTVRGNYIRVPNQSGSTLTIEGQTRNGAIRGSIAGFQVVQVPEPSGAILVGFGVIGIALRRRRK